MVNLVKRRIFSIPISLPSNGVVQANQLLSSFTEVPPEHTEEERVSKRSGHCMSLSEMCTALSLRPARSREGHDGQPDHLDQIAHDTRYLEGYFRTAQVRSLNLEKMLDAREEVRNPSRLIIRLPLHRWHDQSMKYCRRGVSRDLHKSCSGSSHSTLIPPVIRRRPMR